MAIRRRALGLPRGRRRGRRLQRESTTGVTNMWHRPERGVLSPSTTALIVFDMLEIYRPAIERSGVLPTVVDLVDFCRTHGVLVCFARAAHRPDGADFTRVIADTDPDFVPW